MLKLSTAYMKKIPVGGDTDFTSQSFHASLELELSDSLPPEQIRAKIHDNAELLRRAVDDELAGAVAQQIGLQPQSSSQRQQPQGQERKASNAQIKYLTDLAAERKMPLQDLNADVQRRFGVAGIYDLTSKQASAVLDDLKGTGQRRRAA